MASSDQTTISRFSSRTHQLDQTFLRRHLKGAKYYKRIAGYFTSSLFDVAKEDLFEVKKVRIVCNTDIHPNDLKIAKLYEAKMLGRWNENCLEAEALMNRDRYRRLYEFLQKHGQAIRVAPDQYGGFLHGKAGVIKCADGRKLGFIGSANETQRGWQSNYEFLWEDSSPDGVQWIEDEFNHLWRVAKELPRVVIKEVARRGRRREVSFEELDDLGEITPAALVESPLYREGFSLQPWQLGFLAECLRHYRNHGLVRLLLADEVGLGKTLSLGTAALALSLLQDRESGTCKPVAVFAPATLCEQWQTELVDKLGIPSGRWETRKKVWVDHEERDISPIGAEHIVRCPMRIGIISTGLMMRNSEEKRCLLGLRFGLIILDEAHKARSRQGFEATSSDLTELLAFARDIAARTDHVLLATATPIQTRPEDLWDLVRILHQGKGRFVLGNQYAQWHRPQEILPILSRKGTVDNLAAAWELLRSPIPLVDSTNEPHARKLYSAIREDAQLGKHDTECNLTFVQLSDDAREILAEEIERNIDGAGFFQRENPFVRHIVLRRRVDLEEAGLLAKIAVDLHPDRDLAKDPHQFSALFDGKAVRIEDDFREAYQNARDFGTAISKHRKAGGFMKNLMEQRVCSSVAAGLSTAYALLAGKAVEVSPDDHDIEVAVEINEERGLLEQLITRLERLRSDPKLEATIHYLENERWLEFGTIVFSQYYDTARWIAESLAAKYPEQAIGLYAGASRSRLYRNNDSVSIDREVLKRMVAEHKIKIMVATDAACEGLNLQTLGTLINIDLPWNPTRLEQRLGRIKRFGQARDKVDMLNLVNAGTVDESVYDRLSERMRDRYDIFGSVPDTIKDDWIKDVETLGEKMDEYIATQREATGFDLRYRVTAQPPEKDWRDCAEVLSRRDFASIMSSGWRRKNRNDS